MHDTDMAKAATVKFSTEQAGYASSSAVHLLDIIQTSLLNFLQG